MRCRSTVLALTACHISALYAKLLSDIATARILHFATNRCRVRSSERSLWHSCVSKLLSSSESRTSLTMERESRAQIGRSTAVAWTLWGCAMLAGRVATRMKHTGVGEAQGKCLSLKDTALGRASIRPSKLPSEGGSEKLRQCAWAKSNPIHKQC
jgi:hypothetical protein